MEVSLHLLQKSDLETADHLFRLAFGTAIGLPKPIEFCGDADYIQTRWLADPAAAFAAASDGQLLGTNFAKCWGSVGFFGPLSVHPAFWNQGIAQHLINSVLAQFSDWGVQQAGLFTSSNSAKHHALYQKFGFYPRFLTFLMAKPIAHLSGQPPLVKYSELSLAEQSESLRACQELTELLYPGLDLSSEILTVQAQNLGDTVLFWDDAGLVGFAVCHSGAGTEAGSGVCLVKFGAVRSGAQAGAWFEQLLDRCEQFAAAQGMTKLLAGVNTSHAEAYARLAARQYRTEIIGVAMHKPNLPGYHRSDVFVLDDWR